MDKDLVEQLWESDEASALTNAAARHIESLQAERDDLAREVAAYEDMKAQSDAAGGPSVLRRQMELRRYKVRIEAAESERDAAVLAEREACAQTVEGLWAYRTCQEVADAIRARSNKDSE